MRILELVVLRGIGNIKGASKAVAEVVRRSRLKSLAVVHESLDAVGVLGTCELVGGSLYALDNRNRKIALVEVCVNVQHLNSLLACLLRGGVHSVALLPEELTGSEEGTSGLLPTNDRAPLIVELGKVAVGVDNVSVMLAEESLGSRTNAKLLGELFCAAVSYPCNLGSKARNVILLLLEKRFGNEHRHIYVLVTELLESGVKDSLNILPDSVAVGANDHTSLYAGVVDKIGLLYDVGVPFCEVLVHRGDLCDELLVVLCHTFICILSKDCNILHYII